MAKVQYGALVQDARGSIGGITMTKNRYGAVARQNVSPVQPRTQVQMQSRANFSQVSKAWAGLTALEQQQWATWAANHPVTDVFGKSITLAGNAAFMAVNKVLLTLGLAISPTPLATAGTPGPAATSATATASTQTLAVTLSTAPVDTNLYQILATRGFSPGAQPTASDFRVVKAGVVGTSATVSVVTSTVNPKLAFIAGQNVACIVARYDDAGNYIDSTRFTLVAA